MKMQVIVLFLTFVSTGGLAGTRAADGFPEKVAGLLESRCVRCHGGTSVKGKLDLHTREGAAKGGLSGPAVVPGKPEESLLIDFVTGDEPLMPKGGAPLSADEVTELTRWIAAGAEWPEGLVLKERKAEDGPWWAIQPLTRPEEPRVAESAWVRTPIDAFVKRGLDANGLKPRPEADRVTLIRRLSFDLHGLPPTPEEVDTFVADSRPDAYERLVNRMLDSPRYGERWARHWLDIAHYGDTHGYDKDKRRDHAYPYRDYVIRALNEDKSYTEFVREQIAGDAISPTDPEAVAATGFVAAGPWDFVGHVELREGTVDKAKTRLVDRDDMLASTMSTFVSLTVHCARCHDHKFDPIPQRDYYRLQAVFAGVDRGDRPLPSESAERRRQALVAEHARAVESLTELRRRAEVEAGPQLLALDASIRSMKAKLATLARVEETPGSPSNGYHSAIHPTADAEAWVQVDLGRAVPIDEIRLVPARPVDFPDSPGFGFPSVFRVETSEDPGFSKPTRLASETRPDSTSQGDEPYIIRPSDVEARYVRVTATRLWERQKDYVFALSELEVLSAGENLAPARERDREGLDRGRSLGQEESCRRSLQPGSKTGQGQFGGDRANDLLFALSQAETEYRTRAEEAINPALKSAIASATREVERLADAVKNQPASDLVYALKSHDPRAIHVLSRGDVEQPGEAVMPGALSCVPGLDAVFSEAASGPESARRAALAEWIVDRENMLTWRSIVNRVWQYHFGRGLVDTPSDFGRNGSKPSHPELLDWLAVEFRDGGQSLKALHRLIVTSATYRQSSAFDEASARADGGNRLLWRMNRRRLEAEEIRDAVLAVSGQLDDTMYGPGFELFRFKDDHSPIYDHDDPTAILKPEGHRRSVYRFIVRSVPNPFVECLDGADPNANTPVRNATITALQALTLWNDLFMLDQSDAFARRLRAIAPEPEQQIEAAYRLAFGRAPRDEERGAFVAYAAEHGLASACRVLLNANEFLFVD